MKRQIISWGMMLAAAFTLTNCAKEIDAPVQEPESVGYPFEIVASTVDTKTVNDGMSTKWVANDKINVFHALGESTEYVDDGAFTVSDVEAGVFTGTIAEELDVEEEYDWFVMYPYSSYIKTPGAKTDGYTYIGYSTGLNQSGYDSMASLKGSVCPLYGVLKYGGVNPVIEMQHLSSIVAINVTNNTDEPLTVTTASFTATEDIVGSYFIDITKTPVEYTAKTATATATVNVSNGTALAKGESAILYAAIKPFKAAAGQKLTLSVNGYSKEITLSKDVTFTAGKIKTVNFSYDKIVVDSEEEATMVTVVASELGFVNATDVTSVSNGLLKFSVGTNESSNGPKYYTSGSAIRMYTGNTLTVTAPAGAFLTKISFTFAGVEYSKSLTCTNSNGYSNGIWEGEMQTVDFKVSGSDQTRITKVVVEYVWGEGGAPEKVGIEVVDPKVEYLLDTDFVEPKVNVVYSNGAVEAVSGAVFTGYDLSVEGEQEVLVTYEDFSTSYNITVSAPEGDVYTLYTGTIVEGDYIIVYDGDAMNTTVASSRLQYSSVEILNDEIFNPSENIVWHISKNGSYWTLYNASAKKYAASTGAKNKAQMLASGTDDMSLWTISGTSKYEFVNKKNAANNVNKNLRRNGTYGFACYATATGGALTLYKKN